MQNIFLVNSNEFHNSNDDNNYYIFDDKGLGGLRGPARQ